MALKTFLITIDFNSIQKKVNGYPAIVWLLQNICFCVQQIKEIHIGLEQDKGE